MNYHEREAGGCVLCSVHTPVHWQAAVLYNAKKALELWQMSRHKL